MSLSLNYKLKTLGFCTVSSAGTAVPLSSSNVRALSVCIQADSTNTGSLYVGDSAVTANGSTTAGIAIPPAGSYTVAVDPFRFVSGEELNLSEIYLNATTSGDKGRILAVMRTY